MILKTLFYLPAVLAIIYEYNVLIETKKVFAFQNKYKETEAINCDNNQKAFTFFTFGYFLWIIIGIFSSQWIGFVSIIALAMIPKKNFIVLKIDAFLTLCIIVFMVLNAFHFHIKLI